MEKIQKVFRIVLLILLITLAMIGVGLSGGIPIPNAFRKKEKVEIQSEMVEKDKAEESIKP